MVCRMENRKKIIELIESALEFDDYEFRINFLVAGMMSAESNDTPEKIKNNESWLSIIAEYARNYRGSVEKENYFSRLSKSIKNFLNCETTPEQ